MPEVALTFDDGPHPLHTRAVLERLDKFGVPATFFVVGKNVRRHPEVVRETHLAGHSIGNHSFGHQFLSTVFGKIFEETQRTQELIEALVGPVPKVFRSPYGMSPPWLLDKLYGAGFAIAPTMQALRVGDCFPGISTDTVVRRVLEGVGKSSIIVLHEGLANGRGTRTASVRALDRIIPELRNRGYEFKTLNELMDSSGYRQLVYP
ncbi:polysaccharide deacetylase family protein [Candidatus Daviesbacteria bacterium]|nr:polysaccharide deacetylase family protein [Candidatus Daviesbacteria bacterium]